MMNRVYFAFFVSLVININLAYSQELTINSEWNDEYKKSIELFEGKLTNELRDSLIFNLQKINPDLKLNRKLLINYIQDGQNCIISKQQNNNNSFKFYSAISKKVTKKRKTENFLIYDYNSRFSKYLMNDSNWTSDLGFYKRYFFRSNQNCSAFAIVYPSGYYYIYYGEDYFSVVEKLLKKKK